MAKLVLRTGSQAGAEYPIKDARFSMGRRSQSHVPVGDAKCSREHAVLVDLGGTLFLQDLSRNGTLVNEKPALKTEPGTPLKFGDKIRIGDTVYELIDEKSEPIAIDIPGYTIMEKIGSGGMGAVYKARQLSMDRVVALKVLNERYSNNAEFVDRFIREARAAGKLNHPNVIHVHDISRANGRHYFSMEFIDGPSVRELLKKEKKIELNKALDIVLQAGKALEFAHENRIVHRDIKPDNLMLTREGIVKIADLGIAKTFEEGGASASKEHRGALGTPHYMAPEQALGKAIDHRADIYSLGATFYHMITGHTPFSGATAQEILKAHVQTSLPPIQDLNKDVPDPVCFIIERMMAKLPEKRYQNMSRLIEDIERVQSGHVKGIERIEATDSSVLRAVKGAPAGKDRHAEGTRAPTKGAKAKPRREARSEASTGPQDPIKNVVAAVIWVALLLGAMYGVFVVLNLLNKKPEVEPAAKSDKEAKASKPQAKALLEEAEEARKQNDLKKCEIKLLKIKNDFPNTVESDAAENKLLELEKQKAEATKQLATKALAEARKFETENPKDLAGIQGKYKVVLDAAGGQPDIYKEALTKLEQLKKDVATGPPPQALSGSAKEALDKAAASKATFDFDGARKALNDYIDATPENSADARNALKKLNEDAEAKIKLIKDKTEALDPLAAAAEWSKYAAEVKDKDNFEKIVKPIIEGLDDKTRTTAEEDLKKASDKAKMNKYADAIVDVQAMQKKWAGQKKWTDQAKSKETSYGLQKTLYDSFLKLLADKVATAPLPLPFPVQTKITGQDKWAVNKVNGESISLEPFPANTGLGVSVKLVDLTPKDQYKLVLMMMPKEPTKEQHLQLFEFCKERGLSDEADKHFDKANADK